MHENSNDATRSSTIPTNEYVSYGDQQSPPPDWPNETMEESNRSSLKQEKSPKKRCSPHTKGDAVKSIRPSKFLEGSMNDRVSNRPPSIYMTDSDATEDLGTQSYRNALLPKGVNSKGNTLFYDAGIEASKPSGVYRFGRALVNAFKPITVWRGFGNNREEKPPSLFSEKGIMQERQSKAEKAYAELKKNGYKGTQPSSRTVECLSVPAIKVKPAMDEARHFPYRDSGVDVDGYCASTESERNSQVPTPVRTPMNPPPTPTARNVVNPLSNTNSPRKSSLHFRKPSFQNLKKMKSQVHLPSTKKQIPIKPGSESENVTVQQVLRKQPSRKNIAKQEKLSKKVSNLEAQLEIARMNLRRSVHETTADANGQFVRGTRAFKPGALASLPSERLLSKGLVINESGEAFHAAPEALHELSCKRQSLLSSEDDDEEIARAGSASQLEKELVESLNQDDLYKKRTLESRHDLDTSSATKQTDVNKSGSSGFIEERPRRTLRSSSKMQETIRTNANECKILELKTAPCTPHKPPNQGLDVVPPLPTTQIIFDSSQVDQARLLSMRFIGDMRTPLGRHPEDLENLRKEFPMVSSDELARYVDQLSRDTEIADHCSLAHHDQRVAPLLARPCSVSSIKTEPRKAPRHVRSALKTSHYNSNSVLQDRITDAMELNVSGATDIAKSPNEIPFPAVTAVAGDRRVENEKPLPIIEREEYEWPDDVF